MIAVFALASVGWVPPKGAPAILFPVLTLFSWLTNTGALGLVLLMAIVSFAVVGFFRRSGHGLGVWQRVVAPVVSGIGLTVVFILIVVYFNTLLTSDPTAPPSATTFLLPAIVILSGVAGIVWGYVLKRRNPRVYAQIGHGTEKQNTEEHNTAEQNAPEL